MREQLEELAPYLALFGLFLIVAALLLPVLTAGGETQLPDQLSWVLVGLGLLFIVAWPLLRPEDLRAFLGARQTRYGGNALLLSASVIGILVALNFIATRTYRLWDLTENKQFSLSNQTIQILESLDRPVQLSAVLQARTSEQQARDLQRLIDKYQIHTDRLSYERIDPEVDVGPASALAQRLELQRPPNNALVAESGERDAIVYAFDEQSVTEAIVKATRDEELTVLFTTGHGELSLEGGGQQGAGGLSAVQGRLEREGYTVDTLNVAAITETLPSAAAIVVPGPRQPFLEEEAALLADYVAQGGSVLLMVDPPLVSDIGDANLGPVLAPWGMELHDDIVLAPGASPLGPAAILVGPDSYTFHTVTKDFIEQGYNTVFPETRSIGFTEPVTTALTTQNIAQATGGAWGETDFEALENREAEPDPATDFMAPLTIAAVGESTADDPYGRLVVFGTSTFASDGFMQVQPLNVDLLLNALNWLTQEEELISIRPTPPDERPMSLPTNPALLQLVMVLFVPLVVLGVGGWIWWERR